MSYFICNTVYVIVPTDDISEEMLNCAKESFNMCQDSLRVNSDSTITLFKIKKVYSKPFTQYQWYNLRDITLELDKAEWSYE